jgi:hypothetical protein
MLPDFYGPNCGEWKLKAASPAVSMDKLAEPFRKAIPPLTSRVLESTVR